MKHKTKPEDQIRQGIEMISTGLLLIEQNQAALSKMAGPNAVDHAARLNAQYLALENLLSPLKDSLKAVALSQNTTTLLGTIGKATVSIVLKSVLNQPKVKEYFTKKKMLGKYMTNQREERIIFSVKP